MDGFFSCQVTGHESLLKILLDVTDAMKISVLAVWIAWLLSHSGVSPRDLDAFVKFEFQYPSAVSVCPGSSVPQSLAHATVLACEGFKEEM